MYLPRWVILSLIALLMLVALGRYVYIKATVCGEGAGWATSPDGRFEAVMAGFSSDRFFGGSRYWLELTIRRVGGGVVWEYRVENFDGSLALREGEGAVTWSADSSSVAFSAPRLGVDQPDFELTVRQTKGQFARE